MNSPAAGALLSVAGLRVVYSSADGRSSVALDSLSFELAHQQTVGVLGQSGSGKSSLAQALLRLLPPNAKVSADQLVFKSTDLLNCSGSELRRIRGGEIALISQEPALSLNPVLTIGRQIGDVLTAHRRASTAERREKIEAILRDVGFDDPVRIIKAYPHQLSGGQRQRAAIAQALVCSPSLLVADEPVSALDTATQAEVLALLRRLKEQRNLAMIFITHNAGALENLADQVIVLKSGEIAETGSMADLRASSDPYVTDLLSPERAFGSMAVSASACLPTEPPLMEVRHISKSYVQRKPFSRKRFDITALEDVSLRVAAGASIAVIGRSGSGKSTLARCIAELEKPDTGEIVFTGSKNRHCAQMIFQDAGTAMNPAFTAGEVIAEPMVIRGTFTTSERNQRVIQAMREVELNPEWRSRKCDEFSGGQKQRLALARALMADPQLLILDEAFSGLDLPLQAQMMRMVQELQTQHRLACIYISHDLSFVSLFASEVLVMDSGRIIESTTPAGLLASRNPITRELVDASEAVNAAGMEAVL